MRGIEKRFPELPHWTFWVAEVSAGVYNVKGKDEVFGANLDLTGEDPDELLRQAKQTAKNMDHQTRRKIN